MIQEKDPKLTRQLDTLKQEYRDMGMDSARKQRLATLNHLYEVGDKAGKLLAWISKKELHARWVREIVDSQDTAHTTDTLDFYTSRPLKS